MRRNMNRKEQIKTIIKDYAIEPETYDLDKVAVEIYKLVEEDIRENWTDPSWNHRQNILGVKK